MFIRKKRYIVLKNELADLRRDLGAVREELKKLSATVADHKENERFEKATLAETLNEWVYGKESADDE